MSRKMTTMHRVDDSGALLTIPVRVIQLQTRHAIHPGGRGRHHALHPGRYTSR